MGYSEIMEAVNNRDVNEALRLVNEEISSMQKEPTDRIQLSFDVDRKRTMVERDILGRMIIDEDYAHDVNYFLRSSDFDSHSHRQLFEAIKHCYVNGAIDVVILMSRLNEIPQTTWDAHSLVELMAETPPSETADMVLFISLLNQRQPQSDVAGKGQTDETD